MQKPLKNLLTGALALLAPLALLAQKPADGDGAYKTGHYRDLFAGRGHSATASHAKIEATFQQLFHGDPQTQSVYFESGHNANGPLAYITDWANNDARTEGMSYGMMIAVELNKKHEFDALWNWAHTYMLVTDPKNPAVGYFAWSMNTDGTPRSTGPAPDGEEYFTMALYFAAHRWGNGTGIYNYQAEADRILRGIRHHPVLTGTSPFRIHPSDPPFTPPDHPWPSPNNTRLEQQAAAHGQKPQQFHFSSAPHAETIGPMVDEAHTMIRFVPNTNNPDTDPSYHLPAFYELWARWGPVEDRAFWAHAAEVSRHLFVAVTGPQTALTPDRVHFDLSPSLQRDGQPVPFSYDSWRSISNWSVDYSWWHKSADEPTLSDRYQSFLKSQGIHTFVDRYTLAGKPLSTRHSTGMVSTAAVGSLAANNSATSQAFVDELWNTPIPSGEQRYYDGMLYLMSLMHCSGEFRIIPPRN
ncbi:glycosyl hydrolase family 8 [Granulicella sp. 5B5]|uniref:glycosyl hydrolase family 8 n=1 Tax=Granulicella sp. 5B5 TaxID=1617967 RepID=UPI0015F698F8|nr:glycosyl hydrolase family 8 [Granulicella sp. 5B5]